MARCLTLLCDRCNAETPEADFFEIAITCEHISYAQRNAHYMKTKKQTVEWCRKCVNELGVNNSFILRPQTETPAPTIEDMIREIVRSEQQEQS